MDLLRGLSAALLLCLFIGDFCTPVSGLFCRTCDNVHDDDDCQAARVCQTGEQCFHDVLINDNGTYYSRLGCRSSTTCAGSALVGKRADPNRVCSSCCSKDLCKTTACQNIDHCLLNPCVFGTCKNLGFDYTCTCQQGYDGKNCDKHLIVDPCLTNPCVFGTCQTFGNQYFCHCDQGYMGLNCDIGGNSTTCLSCQGAVTPRDCETVERCPASQECFADVYATSLGYLRFDLGCRKQQACNNGSHVTWKRYSSTDKLLQSKCCTGNLCNVAVGTVAGYSTPRGPVCYACSSQAHYNSCNRIRVCGLHEKCVIRSKVGHVGQFQTGCERDTVCNVASSIIGKRNDLLVRRDTPCAECCDGDLCNDKCAHQSVNLNPCATQPCINGRCFTSGDNYVCSCYPGYSGSRCETKDLIDQCLSNPCAYGTCHNYGSYYACSCQPGYTGINCDRYAIIDYCSAGPCFHGNCTSTAHGYTCTCHHGYTGTHCDKDVLVIYNDCYPNPCVHGSCSISVHGHHCTCDTGYSGVNCDQISPCQSNPCVHGTCSSTGSSSYTCTCTTGYTGTTCNTVLPCQPNPCVHGTCVSSIGSSSFNCTCNTGYTGTTCDTVSSPCKPNPCVHGTCVSSVGSSSFNCTCDTGYTGTTCSMVQSTHTTDTSTTSSILTTACVDVTGLEICKVAGPYVCQHRDRARLANCLHFCGFC